jgi:hypothetical protein
LYVLKTLDSLPENLGALILLGGFEVFECLKGLACLFCVPKPPIRQA